ncbi:MAG: TerB family tellurite resistance protein [Myxococcales bacterium]|nr:TerB family tellurite resistance protein [Myxococcales bacterium]
MTHSPPMSAPLTDDDRHDLAAIAFLYIACSELTDDDLSSEEMGVITGRVYGWLPVGDEATIAAAVREAAAEYARLGDVDARLARLDTLAHRLRARLSGEQIDQIINDLIAVARADGRVIDAEVDFIEAAARTLGVKICHGDAPEEAR